MKLRTELTPSKILNLDLNTKFYSIGSCFANMIGENLSINKFDCTANPFGILYNPISIFNHLLGNLDFDKSMLKNDSIWYNYNLHSNFRNENRKKYLSELILISNNSTSKLIQSNILIITLGTAYVYKSKETNEIVANCHKKPQKEFIKELLTVEQITVLFEKFYKFIIKKNPSIKIIFTVSPVRHIKDTIELNSVSKSILRIATHQLQENYKNVFYFPSYELLMDDLRDYRFYKDDLLHPTPFAENYIWEKFKISIFENNTLKIMNEWIKITTALNHKSFNPKSNNHQDFLKKQLLKLEEITSIINCEKEIKTIRSQII